MRLAEEGEELADLLKLSPETILIRWVNFHLKKAGQEKRIKNLGKDLSDSVALFHVLHQLDPAQCPLDGIDDESLETRAEKMIANSLAIGTPDVVRPRDIVSGNVKVNTLFVSYIFNTKHGLEELTKEEYDAAAMIDDDVEGSREERAFRLWINSLGIDDVYVNNLYDDCKDGVILAKVIQKIDPASINMKKIDLAPNNDFKKNINNNEIIQACKNMKLKMIGIGGTDLTKGDKKLTLAVVWQLVKLQYLKVIGGKSEDELVKWANETVGGKATAIKNFKDPSLSDSKFLIHMVACLEPRAVNWDLVLPGDNDEDKANNAKYAISIARKLGAVMFCVWDDLVNVNSKQILIFAATVYEHQKDLSK